MVQGLLMSRLAEDVLALGGLFFIFDVFFFLNVLVAGLVFLVGLLGKEK